MKILFPFAFFAALCGAAAFAQTPTAQKPITGSPHKNQVVAPKQTIPANWIRVRAYDLFTLTTPPDWRFEAKQGIDSRVGRFTNGILEMSFDYGAYADPLDRFEPPAFITSYETINGHDVRIVRPTFNGAQPHYGWFIGTYLATVPHSQAHLQIGGRPGSPEEAKLMLRIMRTLSFTPPKR